MDEYTNEQLLMELIRRNGREDAPSRMVYSGEWFRTTVDIGDVGEAFLMIDSGDFTSLVEMLND